MKKVVVSILFLSLITRSYASSDSVSFFSSSPDFNKKRFTTIVATEATLYSSTLIGLNTLWYKDYPRSGFHFFNDNLEWLQMDKTGHMVTSYYVGRIGMGLMKWSGVERKKAIWYGGMLGSIFQTTVEVLDGFSSQWGFSVGDFAANTVGSAAAIGQELAWSEQRVVLKYSFNQTDYAQYRTEVLGKNYIENTLKDYNGQTYWASVNISSFLSKESKFPKWLNIAAGYGVNGLIGATSNPLYNKDGLPNPVFERSRQFYLSLDADLTRIKTRSKFLKAFFTAFGFIKIPAPTLEFNKNGIGFNAFYF